MSVRKINLVCAGCGKKFSILHYFKRKTNYCSIKCYWDSTRLKQKRICKKCGQSFLADNSLIQKGYGFYCNRECQFSDYPKRINKNCLKCGQEIQVQPCKLNLVKFCSKKCKDDFERDYVKSKCKKCGKIFELPRSDLDRGRGNFCKYRCYLTYRGPSTLEEKMEKALIFLKIDFEKEIKFKRFHVDFLLKNKKVVIECDGEHWHLSSKNKDRDKRKDELLKSLGYQVYRFTGTEINKLSTKKLGTKVSDLLH